MGYRVALAAILSTLLAFLLVGTKPDPTCTRANRDIIKSTGSVQQLDAIDDRCYLKWN